MQNKNLDVLKHNLHLNNFQEFDYLVHMYNTATEIQEPVFYNAV